MYTPASFKETHLEQLHGLIHAHPLGLLISQTDQGLTASPIPFLLYDMEGKQGVLRAHMAKANPHWQSLVSPCECLIVFQGPEGYVTPSWYPSKAETHRVVPTWNYATVHVRGTPTIQDDPAWLHRQIEDLTQAHEGKRPEPWSVHDAPAPYIAQQLRAIIGLEIPISDLKGKWKMSQNKDSADRAGVVRGMRSSADPHQNIPLSDHVEHASSRQKS